MCVNKDNYYIQRIAKANIDGRLLILEELKVYIDRQIRDIHKLSEELDKSLAALIEAKK